MFDQISIFNNYTSGIGILSRLPIVRHEIQNLTSHQSTDKNSRVALHVQILLDQAQVALDLNPDLGHLMTVRESLKMMTLKKKMRKRINFLIFNIIINSELNKAIKKLKSWIDVANSITLYI